ncbi:hypothetical protein [Rummeliibacillus pycnus]|uniref:hypothetical protein n=1 Tax=Rummeliibacillus pycnus TaxID=101070 RepID=UPI003D2AE9C2
MSMKMNYLMFFMFLVFGVVIVSVLYLQHNANVSATQNVQIAMESSEVGTARTESKAALDKKATVANMVAEIADSYKGTPYNVEIDYSFLDKNNNVIPSGNGTAATSIQFKVVLLDDNGQEQTTSIQTRTLKEVH